jgi:hypothetical protein
MERNGKEVKVIKNIKLYQAMMMMMIKNDDNNTQQLNYEEKTYV